MGMKKRLDFFQTAKSFNDNSKAKERINKLIDEKTFVEIDAVAKSPKDYTGVITGVGKIHGKKICVFSQDNNVNGGAFTSAQARKILKLYTLALTTGIPVIGIYDSKGACLNDQNALMESLSKLLTQINKLSGVVPQISVVLGPCFGITSLLAANADFVIASKQAQFSIDTAKSDDIKVSFKNGDIAVLTDDENQAINSVKNLISFLPQNNLEKSNYFEPRNSSKNDFESISFEIFNQSENIDYNNFLLSFADNNNYIEIQKAFGNGTSIALLHLNGTAVGNVVFNGKLLDSNSSTKAARFVRFCDAFSIPIVTFVDAQDFTSLRDAAKLSNAYCDATTAKISVITGKAFGSVFAATSMQGASSDFTLAWTSASVSALNPVTAAIFYESENLKNSDNPIKDRKDLIKSYIQDKTAPFDMAKCGLIQNVILPSKTRDEVTKLIDILDSKRVSKLPKKHSNIQL